MTSLSAKKRFSADYPNLIGIDVHNTTWDVAIAPEVGVVKRHSQKASAKELFDFLKKHYPDGDYQAGKCPKFGVIANLEVESVVNTCKPPIQRKVA